MWPASSTSSRRGGGGGSSTTNTATTTPTPLGYGIPPELGMFVVAPAAFHHHHPHHPDPTMILPAADTHHHHHHHHNPNASSNAAATALGVGMIPLLTDEIVASGGNRGGSGGAIHFWQPQQHNFSSSNANATSTPPHEVNYLKKTEGNNTSINFDQNPAVAAANLFASSGGIGTLTCQDCGNQAKKDCTHRRCRTCCRSRGFDCSSHVKSTWVPAARRRERQAITGGTTARPSGGDGGGASSGSTSGAKKPRLITSQNTTTTTTSHTNSASNTPPRSYETTSIHQDASCLKERFPGQVRAPAVFKCVRVSAIDEGGEDEYAYQAVVKIGGHVFKGFLYDQGIAASSSSSQQQEGGFPNMSDLHLSGGGGHGSSSSRHPLLDAAAAADVYGNASHAAAGLLGGGGSTYGNTP